MDRERIRCIQTLFALSTKGIDKQVDPVALHPRLVTGVSSRHNYKAAAR